MIPNNQSVKPHTNRDIRRPHIKCVRYIYTASSSLPDFTLLTVFGNIHVCLMLIGVTLIDLFACVYVCDQSMMGKTTLHTLKGRRWLHNSTLAQHISTTKVKVKQSRYRTGVAQRVPGS
jgi:hypothetical protein